MLTFFEVYSNQLIVSSIAIGTWILLKFLVSFIVTRRLRTTQFSATRRRMALKSFGIVLNVLLIASLITTWSVEQEDILLLISSIVTVLGVAFFAQWSHLSNITSGVIIFLNTSTKIGDHIRVLDKDFELEGEIFDIGLMFFTLKNAKGEFISLPNNAIIQKGIKTNLDDSVLENPEEHMVEDEH